MDNQALCLAGAPTRPASPDARAASAMGSIDPPPSAGPVPSAPRLPDEPIALRTRARKGQAAKRPSQPEPPASEPPAPEPPKLLDPPAEQLVALSNPPLAVRRTKKSVSKASVRVVGPTGEEVHFNEMPLNRLRTEVQFKFNIRGDFTLVVRDQSRFGVDSQPALEIALRCAIQHGRFLVLSVEEGSPTLPSPIYGPKPILEPGEEYRGSELNVWESKVAGAKWRLSHPTMVLNIATDGKGYAGSTKLEERFFVDFDVDKWVEESCADSELFWRFKDIKAAGFKEILFNTDDLRANPVIRSMISDMLNYAKIFDQVEYAEWFLDFDPAANHQRHFPFPLDATHHIYLIDDNWEKNHFNEKIWKIRKWVQVMVFGADESESDDELGEQDRELAYREEEEEIAAYLQAKKQRRV